MTYGLRVKEPIVGSVKSMQRQIDAYKRQYEKKKVAHAKIKAGGFRSMELTAGMATIINNITILEYWIAQTKHIDRAEKTFRRRRDKLLARLAPPATKPEGE